MEYVRILGNGGGGQGGLAVSHEGLIIIGAVAAAAFFVWLIWKGRP